MKKMMCKARLFRNCYDRFWEYLRIETKNMPHETNGERLTAMVAFFTMFSIGHILIALPLIVVISAILWIMTWASANSYTILAILCLVWMIIDCITPQIIAKTAFPNNAVRADKYADFLICPVLKMYYGRNIDRDLLIYTGAFLLGDGLYYSLPEPITDELNCKTLQRKLIRKYAELERIDAREIINSDTIQVKGTFIFIKG